MENTVTLDFSNFDYSDAQSYDEQSFIHRSKMEEIRNIWNQLYDNAVTEKETGFQRCHNTISVFASRGAGKTSFLLSFLNRIKENKKDILCLDPIDPSLIESKQHPFINILARIQECFENEMNNNYYSIRNRNFEDRKNHEDCYNELLKALPFIDGIGKENVYDEWNDEEFISIQGMNKAKAFNNLEKRFHVYIGKTLKLLNKKCIVIPFDDIDTDFTKGFETLEVLRKFLTSRQIITILTGDLELYSKLVRKANWSCFDDNFIKKEIEHAGHTKKEFADMINQLENQYLIKLLKPEYRIHLKTIREYLKEEGYSLDIIYPGSNKNSIEQCYNELLDNIGLSSNDKRIKTELCHFLLGLSLREQIRILRLLSTNKNSKEAKRNITTGLVNIFANDINQKAFNTQPLISGTPVYTIEMLKFLIHTNALHTGSHFMPETSDDILNKALLAIGVKYNDQVCNNPFLIFDYWIRLSYVKALSEKLEEKSADQKVIKELLDFSQLTANTDILKSIGLTQAFCNSILNRTNQENIETMPGTIFIGNNSPTYLSDSNQVFAMLPMLGSIDTQKHEYVFISIYRLMAIVRDILFYNKKYENHERFLEEIISKAAAYISYLQPRFIGPIAREEELSDPYWEDLTKAIKKDDLWISIIKNLIIWIRKTNHIEASTSLLYLIFVRFYNTMLQIDKNDKYKSVGLKFNAYIVALLNAALVEEMMERSLIISDVNFNVLGDIELIYVHNRRIAQSTKRFLWKKYSIYEWLAECPLLYTFLHPDLRTLLQNKSEESEQYLAELYKYKSRKSQLTSLQKRKKKKSKELDNYNNALNWIDSFIQLKSVENELLTYNNMPGLSLSDGMKSKYQILQDSKQNLLIKIKEPLRIDEFILQYDMEKNHVEMIQKKLLERREDSNTNHKVLSNEIKQLEDAIQATASFIKEAQAKQKYYPSAFDILDSIHLS